MIRDNKVADLKLKQALPPPLQSLFTIIACSPKVQVWIMWPTPGLVGRVEWTESAWLSHGLPELQWSKDGAPPKKNNPKPAEANSPTKDGIKNGVQIYFPSIPCSLPHPHSPCHSLLLFTPHPHRDVAFTVFSFLKYVQQLDSISPRDKSSQEVEKK